MQENEGAPPTGRGEGQNGDIRVGEAWSERVVEPEGGSQGQDGVDARGAGQQLSGEEKNRKWGVFWQAVRSTTGIHALRSQNPASASTPVHAL